MSNTAGNEVVPQQTLNPTPPVVSVIVPACNEARHISETLKSVLAQTYKSIEVIVVDDGSSDLTTEIVEEFMQRDGRVRLICQQNAGVGAARNRGIQHARGKYVAPVDADDLWHPTKLEKQVACMEAAGEQTGMVYCWSEHINECGHITARPGPTDTQGRVRTFRAIIARNFIGNASVPLFRKTAVEKAGYYLTRTEQGGAQGCEDWYLSIQLAKEFEVHCVPEYLVGYRQIVSSMTLDSGGMAKSYDCIMQRVRQGHPEVPASVFYWSAGNFYRYLSEKCYWAGRYGPCLRHLARAVYADPALLLKRSVSFMFLKAAGMQLSPRVRSAYRRIARKDAVSQPLKHPAPPLNNIRTRKLSLSVLWERIEQRRWSAALNEDPPKR